MFGACTGDGGGDGDKPTGKTLNTENPPLAHIKQGHKIFQKIPNHL